MLTLAVLLACAQGLYSDDIPVRRNSRNERRVRSLGEVDVPYGCLFEGRWYTEGAVVSGGDACLRCACGRGALACRRRACAPLPDPTPRRCHVLHKRNSCCPELHCPEGVTSMERGAVARFQEDFEDIATPSSVLHACVEGGTIYAAGSALRSSTACEQCFCLGGTRRCVRPRCLPPPPGCTARPAPGACCPQRYYCQHLTTIPPDDKHAHDCKVDGVFIGEGERVVSAEGRVNCTQCFCLRGEVRCQPLACAPPLLGCQPLLRPGECCAHQYQCEHKLHGSMAAYPTVSDDRQYDTKNYDRAFHSSRANNQETATKNILSTIFTAKNTHKPTASATNNHLIATTKVKRKTEDLPSVTRRNASNENTTTTTTEISQKPESAAKLISTTTDEMPATEQDSISTEQPEGTVRIMINGTINCTAELSNSLPFNLTANDTERIKMESQARVPIVNIDSFETQTYYPDDIITDRSVSGNFDENETFTINVTSSLMTNTSHSTAKAPMMSVTMIAMPTNVAVTTNSSKKVKGDYDYDYTEPTLPPSLPNLKIIPFVAADAVVEDKPPKETLTYPMLEREDKFPIYYPSSNTKETPYATRREDVYNPTQYPVFVSGKQSPQYPSLADDVDLTNTGYSNMQENLDTVHEYTVSSSIGNRLPDVNKAVTKVPTTISTTGIEIPSLNLFSPPVETEGGFIPKGPGVEEFYSVYSSTPASPVAHLTTSMQLNVVKGECQTSDGRRIPEGDTISLACSECACAWGKLHCIPRPCLTPPGCRRKPASSNSADLCCGELICNQDEKTTTETSKLTTEEYSYNRTRPEINSQTEKPYVDPPTKQKDNGTNTSNNTIIKETNKTNTFNNTDYTLNRNITTKSTTTTTSTTERPTTPAVIATTMSAPNREEVNETTDQSLEYEDDEDDEGFSFGSVLKLLLSDTYETTTTSNNKKQTTKVLPTTRPTPLTTTTIKPAPPPPEMPFIPLPNLPYIPQKKIVPPTAVNRIDHLILGEASAIKKTTPRPINNSTKPVMTFKPMPSVNQVTNKPTPISKKEETVTATQDSMLAALNGVGSGLLKLAGCNIYGTMYRVGRIIAELSTPCEECWCTELGIQCNRLAC